MSTDSVTGRRTYSDVAFEDAAEVLVDEEVEIWNEELGEYEICVKHVDGTFVQID